MRQINEINLQRMNNGAHFTFMSDVLARALADEAVMAKAEALVNALKTAVAAEDDALKLSQKNMLTDDIAKADSDRDSLYYAYKQAVESTLGVSVEALQGAAKVLAQHIKDYRIDPKAELHQETGLLVNFIADLEGKYQTQVATLGLTAIVAALKEANERVRSYTLQRTEDRMAQQVGAMKAARLACDDAYRKLVQMVNALAVVFGEADYAKFIDYMNTEITQYKRQVLGQKVSADDGGDTTPDDGGTTPDDGGGTDPEPDPDPDDDGGEMGE